MDKEIAEQPNIDLYMETWDCPIIGQTDGAAD